MESLLIARDMAVVNNADFSLPLELFWYKISDYHMVFYHLHHKMSIYPIVQIQLSFVQFSILCYEF